MGGGLGATHMIDWDFEIEPYQTLKGVGQFINADNLFATKEDDLSASPLIMLNTLRAVKYKVSLPNLSNCPMDFAGMDIFGNS